MILVNFTLIIILIINFSLSAGLLDILFEKCVPIHLCPEIYQKVQSTLTDDDIDELQSLVCDSSNLSVNCKLPIGEKNCGIDTDLNKIYGGDLTLPNEYIWMAQLYRRNAQSELEFWCGASIINKRYLLTAAHCIKQNKNNNFDIAYARLGEWDSNQEKDCLDEAKKDCNIAKNVQIEKIIIHENYDLNLVHNDIALVRLAEDITFTKFINPICLQLSSKSQSFNFDGKYLKIVGFGKTENKTESNIKLQATIRVMKNRRCRNIYGTENIIHSQICAGGTKGIDSCTGDSGGPLMYWYNRKMYLAGIVSYGSETCGRKGFPAIYTRVSSYINWIIENMDP